MQHKHAKDYVVGRSSDNVCLTASKLEHNMSRQRQGVCHNSSKQTCKRLHKVQKMGSTLMSFQSKKLHNFKALLSTMGVTSLITCSISSALEEIVQEVNFCASTCYYHITTFARSFCV